MQGNLHFVGKFQVEYKLWPACHSLVSRAMIIAEMSIIVSFLLIPASMEVEEQTQHSAILHCHRLHTIIDTLNIAHKMLERSTRRMTHLETFSHSHYISVLSVR
jgi:hypothetical protein